MCGAGPVFRTDDLMQVFRSAVIPSATGRARSPPPLPPPPPSAARASAAGARAAFFGGLWCGVADRPPLQGAVARRRTTARIRAPGARAGAGTSSRPRLGPAHAVLLRALMLRTCCCSLPRGVVSVCVWARLSLSWRAECVIMLLALTFRTGGIPEI
jgi:hypothetical protein